MRLPSVDGPSLGQFVRVVPLSIQPSLKARIGCNGEPELPDDRRQGGLGRSADVLGDPIGGLDRQERHGDQVRRRGDPDAEALLVPIARSLGVKPLG